jgi:hypothetical protein
MKINKLIKKLAALPVVDEESGEYNLIALYRRRKLLKNGAVKK